jgi:hypothetical protein
MGEPCGRQRRRSLVMEWQKGNVRGKCWSLHLLSTHKTQTRFDDRRKLGGFEIHPRWGIAFHHRVPLMTGFPTKTPESMEIRSCQLMNWPSFLLLSGILLCGDALARNTPSLTGSRTLPPDSGTNDQSHCTTVKFPSPLRYSFRRHKTCGARRWSAVIPNAH